MSAQEFAQRILTLATRFRFSVTSWGRTPKRNENKGGHPNSRHQSWQAADVVLDDSEDLNAFEAECRRIGLIPVDESDHIHVQTP